VRAPIAARQFEPGQFYRLQNYETYAPEIDGTRLAMEGIALTGAWTDKERGLLSLIILEMGGSSRLCALLKPGEPVVVIGPGPIYAVSLGPFGHTAILPFVMPSQAGLFGGSAWGGQALKWDGAPSYHGPVLIRGRKLTAHDGLGFGAGIVPQAEMDVPPGSGDPNAGGWRFWSGYARLRSPGCYGLQVDGTTFSEIIIFRACTSSNPVRQTGRCKSR